MTINAGSSASFTAKFSPPAVGSDAGGISIVSNAPGSPAVIALSGVGIEGQLGASPSSVNFGSVAVGSNGTQSITLTNSGSASVTISQATVSGTGLSISGLSTPLALGAGLSTTFSAQFTPTSAGSASGSISIVNNGQNSPTDNPLEWDWDAATIGRYAHQRSVRQRDNRDEQLANRQPDEWWQRDSDDFFSNGFRGRVQHHGDYGAGEHCSGQSRDFQCSVWTECGRKRDWIDNAS